MISTQVTGHLLIEMPKINENAPTLFAKSKARAEKEERLQRLNGERKPGLGAPPTQSKKQSVGVHAKPLDNRRPALSASMADLMVKDSSSRRKRMGWPPSVLAASTSLHRPLLRLSRPTTTTSRRRRARFCNF